jgi:outer membrane protein assembly factor BamE (lipoprotein component of BamABCDE complex)
VLAMLGKWQLNNPARCSELASYLRDPVKVKSMPVRATSVSLARLIAAALVAASLTACSMGSGMALVSNKTEGYAISDDALAQIRNGQSAELVLVVLGSPQSTNSFDGENAWYYVETKVAETAFGMRTIISRKVLAIYFDKNKKVKDKAIYSAADGKIITIESRKTPSYGVDKTFLESIMDSFF